PRTGGPPARASSRAGELGVAAHVHYGVSVGEDATLAPDSFLMKGEEVPAGARWYGNPATEARSTERPCPVPAS
ncbi:hypothetical protein, partial [Streptomyces sp. NPDC001226]